MKLTGKQLTTLAIVAMLTAIVVTCGFIASAKSSATEWSLQGKTVIDLSHVQDDTMPADPALKLPALE